VERLRGARWMRRASANNDQFLCPGGFHNAQPHAVAGSGRQLEGPPGTENVPQNGLQRVLRGQRSSGPRHPVDPRPCPQRPGMRGAKLGRAPNSPASNLVMPIGFRGGPELAKGQFGRGGLRCPSSETERAARLFFPAVADPLPPRCFASGTPASRPTNRPPARKPKNRIVRVNSGAHGGPQWPQT